jgi:hypothetical protein
VEGQKRRKQRGGVEAGLPPTTGAYPRAGGVPPLDITTPPHVGTLPYHKNQVLGPTPTQEEEKEGVRGSILIHKEKEEDLGPPPIHREKEKGEKEKGEIFQQDSSGVLDFEEKEREKDQDKDPNLEFR